MNIQPQNRTYRPYPHHLVAPRPVSTAWAWFALAVIALSVIFVFFFPFFPATVEPWHPQAETIWQKLHEHYDPNRDYIREARERGY